MQPLMSSSSWGCELKYLYNKISTLKWVSSSSWGCELKYRTTTTNQHTICHPLREDVSWNTKPNFWSWIKRVILFVRMWVEISSFFGWLRDRSHPLREDVSWNICFSSVLAIEFSVILFVRMWVEILLLSQFLYYILSSSSWGCELKYIWFKNQRYCRWSSSSWGCELKFLSWKCFYFFNTVILFVRMWVEI